MWFWDIPSYCVCCCVQLYARLQAVRAEMRDVIDEHVINRQELEQTQLELTRELKYR